MSTNHGATDWAMWKGGCMGGLSGWTNKLDEGTSESGWMDQRYKRVDKYDEWCGVIS